MPRKLFERVMQTKVFYLCAAQPRVLRLDFGGPGPPNICPLTFFLLRRRSRRPSSGPAPSVSKLAPTRLSRFGGREMLHAARPLHCAPHMLGAQKLALGTRKLFQARHRDGSTWASPRGGTARGVVLSPHGEGGHQVGAPPVGCVRGPHACQTILISWGAGVRPCPRCWPKFCPK